MSTPSMPDAFDRIETCIREQMGRWRVPGVAVGVLQDGQTTTRGYGVASIETEAPVRPDTLFQIGSISKVFTATLVMRLVGAGQLDLNTPVVAYLPNLKLADEAAQRAITLRHLLSHTSGIWGDYFDDFGHGDDALEKSIATYHTLRQMTPPGATWSYCNSGFSLAGRVIERMTGQPFEQAMRERVLAPLGLERSFYFAHEAITYPVAVGHTQVTPGADEHEVARKYPLPRCVAPAGGIISTVGDLLTFATFHLGDGTAGTAKGERVLSQSSLRTMQTPQATAANFADEYGIGWALRTVDGAVIVEHGGSTNGFQARLLLVPERHVALAILTNSSRGSALYRAVCREALEAYLGLHEEDDGILAMSDGELARFAGTYRRRDGEITLSIEDGGLRREMRFTDLLDGKEEVFPPNLLRPIGDREFIVVDRDENEGSRVDFLLAEDGTPRFLRMGGRLADYIPSAAAGKARSEASEGMVAAT
jgi:CubicO group peptidase (beta-lactamase class C family)